jgi:DNA-binding PadR family transcriptional regulator
MPRNRRGWAFDQSNEPGSSNHTPLTVSLLEPALLILINEKDQHGYSLVSELESLGMGSIHQSVIYRTLREIEVLGWINSDWQTDQTQGPPRRVYRLTYLGKNILISWKNELEKVRMNIDQLVGKLDKERS